MQARTLKREVQRLRAQNLIGGHWHPAGGAREGDSINPANGREIGTFAAGAASDARQAIDAARRAFERGGLSRDPAQRAALLLGWADRLARGAYLAHLLTLENGKVLAQSRHEIATAIACLRQHAEQLLQGDSWLAASQPAGVVAIFVPWHAPVALLVASLAPALAAGCSAVIKPAPKARRSARQSSANWRRWRDCHRVRSTWCRRLGRRSRVNWSPRVVSISCASPVHRRAAARWRRPPLPAPSGCCST